MIKFVFNLNNYILTFLGGGSTGERGIKYQKELGTYKHMNYFSFLIISNTFDVQLF